MVTNYEIFCQKNFKLLKHNLGWNCLIVVENKFVDMWNLLLWFVLSNMWMDIGIWSTTTTFYIATFACHKKWNKMPCLQYITDMCWVNMAKTCSNNYGSITSPTNSCIIAWNFKKAKEKGQMKWEGPYCTWL